MRPLIGILLLLCAGAAVAKEEIDPSRCISLGDNWYVCTVTPDSAQQIECISVASGCDEQCVAPACARCRVCKSIAGYEPLQTAITSGSCGYPPPTNCQTCTAPIPLCPWYHSPSPVIYNHCSPLPGTPDHLCLLEIEQL